MQVSSKLTLTVTRGRCRMTIGTVIGHAEFGKMTSPSTQIILFYFKIIIIIYLLVFKVKLTQKAIRVSLK